MPEVEPSLVFPSAGGDVIEVELGLSTYDRGIFEKQPSVQFRNVDLDIPTYQRKGTKIDQGS